MTALLLNQMLIEAMVSPAAEAFAESLSTLKFAQRAKGVVTTPQVQNRLDTQVESCCSKFLSATLELVKFVTLISNSSRSYCSFLADANLI